jgi:pimeloyl-[acyl-carrier protein] synthase
VEPITDMNKEPISPGKTKKPGAAKAFKFNPLLPEFHVNPYPTYHRLRSEEPVHWSFLGVWVLTRYADVKAVLRDPRFCSDQVPKRIKDKSHYLEQQQRDLNTLAQATSKFIFFLDPPDHTRLRGLVSKAFSLGVVERMRPQIQETVDELISKVWDKGSMDIISDLACPLPVIVIARMLGVPDKDRSKLHQWSNDLSRILDLLMSLEAYEHLNKVVMEFTEYFSGLIAEREKSPKEDLLSALIAAREQGDRLSKEELLATCMMLFATGEESTVNLIGNGMLALLRQPDQMELLKREPALIQSAVEELLRYDTPLQHTARMATEDVEIGGKIIRAGENVLVSLGAANRDPAEFPEPDRLDLTRSENRHLAFADGIHYCLGASLARVEGQIAINTLVQQLPDLKIHSNKLEWLEKIALRGLKALSVTFTP